MVQKNVPEEENEKAESIQYWGEEVERFSISGKRKKG